MITSITIAEVATFGSTPEVLSDLRQFNYIFGSNGTGKTTISRIIADAAFSTTCRCTWKNGTPLEALVLNCAFVEKHFGQLRGVFTLGEDQKDTLEKIDVAKVALNKERVSLAALKRTLEGDDENGGKRRERASLEKAFQEKCWAQKQRHDATLQGAFTRFRNSAQNFKQRVLEEAESNTAQLQSLADLETRAGTIYGVAPTKGTAIPVPETAALLTHESNPILKKKVIGKDDVNIAGMITKLGNSDWIRQGLPYFQANAQVCPFCQQETDAVFAASLKEYFDETFEQDSRAIDLLLSKYARDASTVQASIDGILATPGNFLDVEKLNLERALLNQRIASNLLVLDKKKRSRVRSSNWTHCTRYSLRYAVWSTPPMQRWLSTTEQSTISRLRSRSSRLRSGSMC